MEVKWGVKTNMLPEYFFFLRISFTSYLAQSSLIFHVFAKTVKCLSYLQSLPVLKKLRSMHIQ
jgi:hypothetical protein